MKELFTMWRHTNMIVLVALSAAMYAALLIPFQAIPIIPGHVSLRVANILPVALGLMFGPAGAWGCAMGNLIGDFFGTLSPGAIGGFVANFMIAFLSYKLWNALSPRNDKGIELTAGRRIIRYQVDVALQHLSVTLILTWWVALLLRLAPAEFFFIAVLVPGWIAAAVVTPFILRIISPRIRKWGLLWTDIMEPDEVAGGRLRKVGLALVAVGGVGGTSLLGVSMFVLGMPSSDTFVRFQPVPFLILVFAGSVMMGGREMVEAMRESHARPTSASQ